MRRVLNCVRILAALWGVPVIGVAQLPDESRVAEKILVPDKSWTCNMPGGIPSLENAPPVFEAVMDLSQIHDVGQTPFGYRTVGVVAGGKISGEKLRGTVMSGGLDFQLGFTNGTLELEQILVIKTDDGSYLLLHNLGTSASETDVRLVVDFDAPTNGRYAWLNTGKFFARRTIDRAGKVIKLTFFEQPRAEPVGDASNRLFVTKPSGWRDQPVTFRRAGAEEERGEPIISELVTLGQSQLIPAGKGGERNIIPITGGTLEGRIRGKVLNAGADYQRLTKPMILEARYLWQTEDGDIIIVRNGGPPEALTPTFEVRSDSRYAWLNEGKFLSSSPRVGSDGVRLSFFQSGPRSETAAIAFGTRLDPDDVRREAQRIARTQANTNSPHWQAKGDQRRTYHFDAANEDFPFRVCVPTSWDGHSKLPLVMFLHGGWNNESSYLDQNDKQMVKLAEQHGCLLVSPLGGHGAYGNFLLLPAVFGQPKAAETVLASRSPERTRAQEISERDVINVLEIVLNEYPVDRSAMLLMGHSMGSGGTWYLGAKYSSYWSALAPMSGPFVQKSTYPWDRIRSLPIFMSEGTLAPASLCGSRQMSDWLKTAGFRIEYKEVEADHPGMVPLILPDVFAFFDRCRLR